MNHNKCNIKNCTNAKKENHDYCEQCKCNVHKCKKYKYGIYMKIPNYNYCINCSCSNESCTNQKYLSDGQCYNCTVNYFCKTRRVPSNWCEYDECTNKILPHDKYCDIKLYYTAHKNHM